MKTILAPNAPWPNYEAPKPKAKPVRKPVQLLKPSSRIKHTNAKYDEWASKNLMHIKPEILG